MFLGLARAAEDWQAQVFRAGFFGIHTTNHLGAVLHGLLDVKCALLPGHALANHLGVLVNPHLGSGGLSRLRRRGSAGAAKDRLQGAKHAASGRNYDQSGQRLDGKNLEPSCWQGFGL